MVLGCATKAQLSEREVHEIEGAVTEAFEGLVSASKDFDFDRYLAFFDGDRFSGLNQDGTVTHSISEFDELYRQAYSLPAAYESLKFHRVKVTVIDINTAILVNEFQAELLMESGQRVSASGGGAQTWSRASGSWKLVSVSSSTNSDK